MSVSCTGGSQPAQPTSKLEQVIERLKQCSNDVAVVDNRLRRIECKMTNPQPQEACCDQAVPENALEALNAIADSMDYSLSELRCTFDRLEDMI